MSDKGSIVITGASTGMGEHCALGLAERGYRVFAGVRKSEDGARLKSVAKGNLTPIIVDVVKEEQVRAAAREVEQMLAGAPECTPIPVRVTAARRVVCRSKFIPLSNPGRRDPSPLLCSDRRRRHLQIRHQAESGRLSS